MMGTLQSPEALAKAWLSLITTEDHSSAMGNIALAHALAYPLVSPDDMHATKTGACRPALHWALTHVTGQPGKAERVCVELPLSLEEGWPETVSVLSPWERLAGLLIASGANPWLTDSEGKDALDWAFEAGFRSVFAQLLRHPQCPSQEELSRRVNVSAGRVLPLTHVAAYRGHLAMLEDLLGAGWSPSLRDNKGWSALSWVNSAADAKAVAPLIPLSTEERLVLRDSWVKRTSLKLVPLDKNLTEQLARFEQLFSLSAEEQLAGRSSDLLVKLLAAKPNKDYIDRGMATALLGKSLAEHADFFKENWGLEGQGSGAQKGQWSLPAAALWATLRWKGSPHKEVVHAFLEQLSKHDAPGWLNTPIRSEDKRAPEVLQGGLAWLAVCGQFTRDGYDASIAEKIRLLEAAWGSDYSRPLGLQKALDFTRWATPANASDGWKRLLSGYWKMAILTTAKTGPLGDGEANAWKELMQMGLPMDAGSWMLIGKRVLATLRGKQQSDLENEAMRACDRLLVEFLGPLGLKSMRSDVSVSNRPEIAAMQVDMVATLAHLHGFSWPAMQLPEEPWFLESTFALLQKKYPDVASRVPGFREWKDAIRAGRLDQSLPSPASVPGRPRF